MRSCTTRAAAAALATALVTALLAGCAALPGLGGGHEKLVKRADALEITPAEHDAGARQRLSDALATIYAGNTVRPLHYYSEFVDLNGDGRREAVVYVVGPSHCADGCDLYVFQPQGARYAAITRIPISRAPVYALAHRSHGWRDLLVTTGSDENGADEQLMRYAGGGYVPVENDPADDAGRTLLIKSLSNAGHAHVLRLSRSDSED
ncbi:hypothetical protein [Salinisphaera sp.]|uniref:hypothetical protein n=1 Tax=Salinisphaera sp. TaxID=1914330 RepID=UPI002D79D5F4|nr:hypothetical protein [Salinisphaera sp.]HET7313213.1 hypothetical protein [Salinisphaera sp.]